MRKSESLIDIIDDYIGRLKPEGLMRDGMSLSPDELARLDACVMFLGIDRNILQLEEDNKYRIDPIDAQLLRKLLRDSRAALIHMLDEGVTQPVLRDFIFDDNDIACDSPKLQEFLRNARLIGLSQTSNKTYDGIYSTIHTRGEVLSAVKQVCPHIAADVETKMYAQGMNANETGRLPMTGKQIEEFRSAYRLVVRKMLTASPQEAAHTMRDLYNTGKKKLRMSRAEHILTRNEKGREVVVLSTRPREESVNHFMLPLEVLKPVKNLLERTELAASGKASGDNEKLRQNPREVWIGCMDRAHTLAEGKLLKAVLKEYPELADEVKEIQCVTIYPLKHSKKFHAVRQILDDADEMPSMDKEIRDQIIPHKAEFWLAIPAGMRDRMWEAVAFEQQSLHESMRDLEGKFNQQDPHAEQALQALMDNYSARGILPQKYVAQAIREKSISLNDVSQRSAR